MKKRLRFTGIWFMVVFAFFLISLGNASAAVTPKIAAGYSHFLAIKSDGTLWAWGNNRYGQLGDGTTVYRDSPVQIGAENDWVEVAAGMDHTIAMKSDRTLWAWGRNNSGQLGDGTTTDKYTPVQIGTDYDWDAVAAGGWYTVALKRDGRLWAWGYNGSGQLGDGTTTSRHTPVQVGTDNDWNVLEAGEYHTLALKKNGTLWAWGDNQYGQLGDGTIQGKPSPVPIGTDHDWAAIAAGYYHTVALKTGGTLWAWGKNDYGQLGDGSTDDKHIPVSIGTDHDWAKISAGYYHSVALKTGGTLWTWGSNQDGQLGDGTIAYRVSPFLVFASGPLSLITPTNGQGFTGCSYYNLPTFSWSAGETFKSFEIQFSSEATFSSPVKVKCAGTLTEIQMKSSIWKKILFLPGGSGGTVYWKVVGTNANKETEASDVRSIMILASQPVGSPEISPTQKSSTPTLFWENQCGKKFKVWFGSDSNITKKKLLSFSVANPMENGGEFERQLTSSQWTGIRNLSEDVTDSTIYWKVESWDALNRHAQTDVMSFVLTD